MTVSGEARVQGVSSGLRYMVLAAFFFSLMALLVKVAGQRLPSAQLVLARSVVGLVLSYGMLRQAGLAMGGQRKGLLLFRGLIGFGGILCFFYALTRLPLAETTVIAYTSPVFTAILAALFLKETLRAKEIAGLVLSLTGVLFVAQPAFLFGTTAAGLDLFAPFGSAVDVGEEIAVDLVDRQLDHEVRAEPVVDACDELIMLEKRLCAGR